MARRETETRPGLRTVSRTKKASYTTAASGIPKISSSGPTNVQLQANIQTRAYVYMRHMWEWLRSLRE